MWAKEKESGRVRRGALDCGSPLPLSAMQPYCEPDGIGTKRLDHSQTSAVDSRL
jgi:hypothetical protein